MKTLSQIIARARALKLGSSELTDSTITITSLGEGFIIGLDEALGIQTPEEDYGRIETLNALLDYLGKKKN